MKTYSIFRVKKEIAMYYVHQGDLLHRFFSDCAEHPNDPILQKQFNYVTHSMPIDLLQEQMNVHQHHQPLISNENKHIIAQADHVPVHVNLLDRQIIFQCDMLHEAETSLFPLLQSLQPFLFVSGLNHDNYGWMSSPYYFKLDYPKQILYS
ncbi:hypothetical protein JNUCC1_03752 [Lentibacillus sp. JNUCC-1]|uniref:sporulation inhibitor of replication protein SirA n=1 Tax=Lentibacillus sp. JNUCC-1 TaxID=2654513 RepID=UPI0012E83129|nr:sporulation inhibitor of replication protein SirA [Lentibacillus sp. JNUCC-1]MUV39868.1 hypothetical protein [Lentibacillus sp. JNUCC-1]